MARLIYWYFAQIKNFFQFGLIKQLSVKVTCVDLHDQRISVWVEHSHIIFEPILQQSVSFIHVELAVLEYCKAELKRLVDYLIDF